MSEGEFKRLFGIKKDALVKYKFDYLLSNEYIDAYLTCIDEYSQKLDEAKKEFPSDNATWYEYGCNVNKWFEKWFGGKGNGGKVNKT